MKRTGQKMNVGSQCNAEGGMEIVMAIMQISSERGIKRQEERCKQI